MAITTTTHLNFRGDARAALEFYAEVFSGELSLFTYRDAGNVGDATEADQIMWGGVTSPDGFRIMAYDVPATRPWSPGEAPVFVSVRGDDASEITRYWQGLSQDASVIQPLGQAGWSQLYSMLKDRFGIIWVLDVAAAPAS